MAVEKSIIPVRIKNYYATLNNESTESTRTSLMLMAEMYKNPEAIENMIIVTADPQKQSADAVCAGPLSRKLNAPILLLNKASGGVNSMDTNVWQFINSCTKLKNIYVVGGPAVIPDITIRGSFGDTSENLAANDKYKSTQGLVSYPGSVNKASVVNTDGTSTGTKFKLTDMADNVYRIWGINRVYTSLQIAEELAKDNINNITHFFISYSSNTMDAYILGAAACRLKQPILYFPSEDYEGRNKSVLEAFYNKFSGKVKKVFISGGSQRIFVEQAKLLKEKLKLTMPNSVERVSGIDRYSTSLSISKEFNALLDSSTSVVYDRDNINDGLCSKLIIINGDPTIVDASVIGVYAADRQRPIICLQLDETKKYLEYDKTTYDLIGYLQNKRPQLIQIFSDRPIAISNGTIISGDNATKSVEDFYMLVKTYGGRINYLDENDVTKYDVILWHPSDGEIQLPAIVWTPPHHDD